jgi:hypothetical protein
MWIHRIHPGQGPNLAAHCLSGERERVHMIEPYGRRGKIGKLADGSDGWLMPEICQ